MNPSTCWFKKYCLDFLLLSEDCSKLYAQLQLLLFFLFQYHILFVFFLLIHYECDVTNAIMPPMINNGKAMYISPPITIPINITGKKITVQSSFIIPQDALNPVSYTHLDVYKRQPLLHLLPKYMQAFLFGYLLFVVKLLIFFH